jgi:hypothetical protein
LSDSSGLGAWFKASKCQALNSIPQYHHQKKKKKRKLFKESIEVSLYDDGFTLAPYIGRTKKK